MSESQMTDPEKVEYDLMMELDRLESLKEEMEDLGVANLAEIEARIKELSRRMDELEQLDSD
jgi:DNA-binding HxlR family transcriptional regulator